MRSFNRDNYNSCVINEYITKKTINLIFLSIYLYTYANKNKSLYIVKPIYIIITIIFENL